MELILGRVLDSPNTIGKSLSDNVITLDILLKRDFDIIRPQLILKSPDGFTGINYAQIPLLRRYYFVNNITNIGGELWQLDLTCDVLQTYMPDILASKARFYRQLQNGDCVELNVANCVYKTITKYESDRQLETGEAMILTTLG